MTGKEVELRLSLKDRQAVARGLDDTADQLEVVAGSAVEVSRAGDKAARGLEKASDPKFARGFAAIKKSAGGAAAFVGRGMVKAAKAGAVGLATASLAAGALSVKSIELAGDARETASAFDTVFGKSATKVGKRLDTLTDQFGLYNPELQDAARQFGVFAKAAGLPRKELSAFSVDLTKAGLDLASFYNTDSGEALQALRSGLSGEAEPLRRFGIFLSDATMKAEAASMGLRGELTESQKVMVRQRIIMKSLGDAQGDLARTSGGFANQQRAASGQVKTFLTMLGGPMTTAATGAFRGFNTVAKVGIAELEKRLPGLEAKAEKMSVRFERWGEQLAVKLPGAIDKTIAKWDALQGRWDSTSTDHAGAQVKGIGADVRDLGPAFSAFGEQLPALNDLMTVTGTVTGFLADHTETLAKWMPVIVAGFVAYKTAQFGANVVAAASPAFKILDYVATRQLTKALRELSGMQGITATTSGVATGAITGQAAATTGATVSQRGLNAVMKANPIGLIITAVTLLVGGFVLLYKNSETFRTGVNWLWNKGLKPFGKWIGSVLVGYFKMLGKAYLTMAEYGLKAFGWLTDAAFGAFDKILGAAEKGLGWIPGIGSKISTAREKFREFSTKTKTGLEKVSNAIQTAKDKLNGLGNTTARPKVIVDFSDIPTRIATGNRGGITARATGGPVLANRPYLVGERRPEIFVPRTSGRILPKVQRAEGLRAESADSIAAALDDERTTLSAGPAWPGGPIVVQLVMPDGRVLTEAVLDGIEGRVARR